MSTQKNPLAIVNGQFGGKAKLVEKLSGLIDLGDTDADDVKKRLTAASNKKLLRLLKVAENVKANFGTKSKLAANVADLLGRAKDNDYVKKLGTYGAGQLLDMATVLGKKAKNAKPAKAVKAAPKAVASGKKSAAPKAEQTAAKPAAKKPAAKKQ